MHADTYAINAATKVIGKKVTPEIAAKIKADSANINACYRSVVLFSHEAINKIIKKYHMNRSIIKFGDANVSKYLNTDYISPTGKISIPIFTIEHSAWEKMIKTLSNVIAPGANILDTAFESQFYRECAKAIKVQIEAMTDKYPKLSYTNINLAIYNRMTFDWKL